MLCGDPGDGGGRGARPAPTRRQPIPRRSSSPASGSSARSRRRSRASRCTGDATSRRRRPTASSRCCAGAQRQLGNGSERPRSAAGHAGALQALPAFLGGKRPRTTLIVDGRRQTFNEFVFGAAPVWDIDRVEVFRSPQTTTQGQNSIAGAIFVYSNDPTFEPEARARVMAGNSASAQLSAAASGALVRRQSRSALRVTSATAERQAGSPTAWSAPTPTMTCSDWSRAKLLIKPRAMPEGRTLILFAPATQAPQIVGLTAPFRERRDTSGLYGTFGSTSIR